MVGYGCYSNDDDGVGDGVANDDYHFVDGVDVDVADNDVDDDVEHHDCDGNADAYCRGDDIDHAEYMLTPMTMLAMLTMLMLMSNDDDYCWCW